MVEMELAAEGDLNGDRMAVVEEQLPQRLAGVDHGEGLLDRVSEGGGCLGALVEEQGGPGVLPHTDLMQFLVRRGPGRSFLAAALERSGAEREPRCRRLLVEAAPDVGGGPGLVHLRAGEVDPLGHDPFENGAPRPHRCRSVHSEAVKDGRVAGDHNPVAVLQCAR